MADLSDLAKKLQAQVDIITQYLDKEKRPPPSFLPSKDEHPMKTTITSLPPDIEKARHAAQSLSWSINKLLTPPVQHLVWTAFQFYDVVAVRFVIEKGIAKMIPVDSPGVPLAELSEKSGTPENRLVHILRQLNASNIFREPKPRVFAHTAASAVLALPEYSNQSDLILHFVDEGYKASAYFPESLDQYADSFDKVQKPELRTAFNLAFNTDMHYFDYIYTPENIPRYGSRFGRSMMGGASVEFLGAVIDLYDWSVFKPGDKIIDIGGGVGHIAAEVYKRVKPGVELIVQDRDSVVEQGKPIYGDIVTHQAHDFFDPQPVQGANVYYLRLILHDWPDAICQTILGHVVKAMNKDSRLLILDMVWKDDDYWAVGQDNETIIDNWSQGKRHEGIRTIHMMNKLGSKERTEDEWNELLGSVGLKLKKIYGRNNWQAIIEAVKV